jgi:hypothetical protein
VGIEIRTVELGRSLGRLVQAEFANQLPIFHQERHVMGAYLQDRFGALLRAAAIAKARIEKAGVVGSQLARASIVGHQFSGIIRGNTDLFFRGQNINNGVGGACVDCGEELATGLGGLKDRVEALGGVLDVVSPDGEGTLLTATFPLDPVSP